MINSEDWSKSTAMVNNHLSAALIRCAREGVSHEQAAFIGLLFFIAAASAGPNATLGLADILTIRKALDDALDQLAAAAIHRSILGPDGDSA